MHPDKEETGVSRRRTLPGHDATEFRQPSTSGHTLIAEVIDYSSRDKMVRLDIGLPGDTDIKAVELDADVAGELLDWLIRHVQTKTQIV